MKLLLPLLTIFLNHPIFSQERYDIIITEIMADPSPQVGLPNYEWIEIKNNSSAPVQLRDYKLGDENGTSGTFPSFILQPDSFLVICGTGAFNSLSGISTAIAVTSFPSFNNDGETIFLRSASGKIMHAVNYKLDWYGNELKKEGGWTLEMMDTRNPCTGKFNWRASNSATGGSPGKINSVNALNPDNDPPELTRSYSSDSVTIQLLFNEPIDSAAAIILSNYQTDPVLTLVSATCMAPLFQSVQLKTASPLEKEKIYSISASNIPDCKNNRVSSKKIKTGYASLPAAHDLIVNEILFDPKTTGYDFVEIYNRNKKILDLSKIFIANRSVTGAISSIKVLSNTPYFIYPDEYIVITEDPENLSLQYFVKDKSNILPLPLPSFPSDEGDVLLLDSQGMIIDEVHYYDNWHFELISNPEGVSLERIDPIGNSNDKTNWHSAASTAGYATPGYKNSQYKLIDPIDATVTVTPKIFSPDNDGYEDVATIQYKVESPGFTANVHIYNPAGRLIRMLVNNELLGIEGYWRWNGLDENGNQLPVGPYIIFADFFNLQGKKKVFKLVLILGRKL